MSSDLINESEKNMNTEGGESNGVVNSDFGNCQIDCENDKTDEERLSEQVFSIPLVLKQIFKHLEREDLLRVALINKSWNILSREVVREKGKCLAIVKGSNFCHNLKELSTLLLNSDAVPFNGISLDVPSPFEQNYQCTTHAAKGSELLSNILIKIPIKYLALELNHPYNSDCIAMECIREIIMEKASSLEELRVNQPPFWSKTFSEFIGLDLHDKQWLPSVRVLECLVDLDRNEPVNMIKEIIEASPKLDELLGPMDTQCLKFVLPLKAARAVKVFDFRPRINTIGICVAFALEHPQLTEICFSTADQLHHNDIHFSKWNEFQQNEVSRILIELLTSSQDSLKTLTCDQLDLILMTSRWNLPVLKQLTKLRLPYGSYIDDTEDYSFWRKIEWAKHFPNLKEISLINPSRCNGHPYFYIGHNFRQSDVQFVCESVKIFRWGWSNAEAMQMFQSIFPNVQQCHLKRCRQWEFPEFLNKLWTGWQDLESIFASIIYGAAQPFLNYDSEFLGISREEATHLLENVEDLESLEIVSTKPCIFNLRKLQNIVIHMDHREYFCRGVLSKSETFFVSRLGNQCAFSRNGGLKVELHRNICEPKQNCQFAFDQLKH